MNKQRARGRPARKGPGERPPVPLVSPENLEKAAEIRRQIIALEAEYAKLLIAEPEDVSVTVYPSDAVFGDAPEPSSESAQVGRRSAAAKGRASTGGTPSSQSNLASPARRVSELNRMSLREAVVRSIQIARGPQTIGGILRKLRMIHYRFPEGTDPARFLGERIYSLPGVKAIGGGQFDLVERLEQSTQAHKTHLAEPRTAPVSSSTSHQVPRGSGIQGPTAETE